MDQSLKHPLTAFGLNPEHTRVSPHKQGHINDTYFIENSSNRFVLQRINRTIFPDVPSLMHNLKTITAHLNNYYRNSTSCTLHLNTTHAKHTFFRDENDSYWRLFDLIPNTQSIDNPTNTTIAYQGAFAFGDFVHGLSDFDPNALVDTIPNFMNLHVRHQQFIDATNKDPCARLDSIEGELSVIQTLSKRLMEALEHDKPFPKRITHNDTKFNNLLFSDTWEPICVVDLDTTMAGSVIHDFSDLVRTAAHRCPEDSTDLSLAVIDRDLFDALYTGYCDGLQDTLSDFEKSAMLRYAHLMPVMIGVRFYTDYLLGDPYFSISHEKHNLDRARVQVRLAEELLALKHP